MQISHRIATVLVGRACFAKFPRVAPMNGMSRHQCEGDCVPQRSDRLNKWTRLPWKCLWILHSFNLSVCLACSFENIDISYWSYDSKMPNSMIAYTMAGLNIFRNTILYLGQLGCRLTVRKPLGVAQDITERILRGTSSPWHDHHGMMQRAGWVATISVLR